MYAYYYECDPLLEGKITKKDQVSCFYISLDVRKPVFGVSDLLMLKPTCLTIETEILYEASLDIILHEENNKGTDQTMRMRRLVCTFVVCIQQSGFLAMRPVQFLHVYFLHK